MSNFRKALEKKLIKSRFNNYDADNYDELRFGEYQKTDVSRPSPFLKAKRRVKQILGYKNKHFLERYVEFLTKYEVLFQRIYEEINHDGKILIIELVAYRLLGSKKVKLARNNKEYWDTIENANSLADADDTLKPSFSDFSLCKYDLSKIGYNLRIYFTAQGIALDFILEQYAFKTGNNPVIAAEKGDIVLDLGGCWGDTALYFASKTGKTGKVYSFEFIPENIKIFNINTSLNPGLKSQIELIPYPVSDKSGVKIFYKQNGPGSRMEYSPFTGQTGHVSTISIDDFVKEKNITKIDFIKMDIEGAESSALLGAQETIKRFKPRLAIAIYHSMDDLVNIPAWIIDQGLGYRLYLGHFTIHTEETVIFAKVE